MRPQDVGRKTAIDKVVDGVAEESSGLPGAQHDPVVHHDLDHLFGSWTRKEADAFDRELARQRIIEPNLWK